MCGILGIYGNDDVSEELLMGLTSIQHRGQDAAGMVTFDETFRLKKGLGYVSSVFKEKNLKRLSGNIGLGHVRYSTVGAGEELDVQPFFLNYPYGLAMVHNGNVTNFQSIRKKLLEDYHRLLDTSNDVALILYTLAAQLEKKDLKNLEIDDIFDAVADTQKMIEGAYSTVTIVANKGILAFADPYGIRPIVMGMKETDKGPAYAFCSESTCFDFLGYKLVRDLEPGEAVFIDNEKKIHSKICHRQGDSFCVFEYIYFAKEDSIINKKLVATERVKMGKILAERIKTRGLNPDIIIDVPNSAYFFASGLAEVLKVPYRRGFSKNNFIGRSFILPSQKERELAVRQKLNPIRDIIKGKKVAVADDSIVRGTTSRHIVKMLKDFGAKEVYFISAAPPVKCRCVYGIDMSIKTHLIASGKGNKEIEDYIGADALVYQTIEDLKSVYHDQKCCYACFSGEYPTGISEESLSNIEKERILAEENAN
ncbi:MAG: amidophosphoribosyltransferase [Pseudomonadota bacterium]